MSASTSEPVGSASSVAAAVREGGASAVDLCRTALRRAAQQPGIFWQLDEAGALADAERVQRDLEQGRAVGALAGVPVAVKDSFDVQGLASRLGLAAPVAPQGSGDADAVGRLRAAGAIVIGKTAMDQLAWSMTGQAPGYPPCENPAAPGCLPGGSSGGSAAAVAAGIVSVALGTDTAGSTRLPAAWCGLVGHKPSYGRVSLQGCAPLAASVDTIGIIATTVEDCRLLARVLEDDGAEQDGPAEAVGPGSGADARDRVRPVRIGVLGRFAAQDTADPGVLAVWQAALERLARSGCELLVLDGRLQAPGFGRVLAAEFSAAWADRLDAARHAPSEAVSAAIEHGLGIAAVDYLRARAGLAAAQHGAREVFAKVDLLLLPTTGLRPPPIGASPSVAEVSGFTRPLGAFGWPSISIPTAAVKGAPVGGGPVGLQLAGPPGSDRELLRVAATIAAIVAPGAQATAGEEADGA